MALECLSLDRRILTPRAASPIAQGGRPFPNEGRLSGRVEENDAK